MGALWRLQKGVYLPGNIEEISLGRGASQAGQRYGRTGARRAVWARGQGCHVAGTCSPRFGVMVTATHASRCSRQPHLDPEARGEGASRRPVGTRAGRQLHQPEGHAGGGAGKEEGEFCSEPVHLLDKNWSVCTCTRRERLLPFRWLRKSEGCFMKREHGLNFQF